MFKFHYQNGKKRWKKFSGLLNGVLRGLRIGAGFRDYKSRQEGLQIRAALEILNQGKYYKSGQRDFKSGQRLQIGARGISNRDSDYNSVQNNNET